MEKELVLQYEHRGEPLRGKTRQQVLLMVQERIDNPVPTEQPPSWALGKAANGMHGVQQWLGAGNT